MSETLEAGRPIFESLSPVMVGVFYVFAVAAVAVFVFGLWQRIAKYMTGRPGVWNAEIWSRTLALAGTTITHASLRKRNSLIGLTHAAIFYGFVTLFAGTLIITIDQDILKPFMPHLQFWKGGFYKGFSLVLDVLGLGLLAGLAVMAARRWIVRPSRLNYDRPDRADDEYSRAGYNHDDQIFLWGLIILATTGFLIEAIRIAIAWPPFEQWSVVGWYLAKLLAAGGLSSDIAAKLHPVGWWLHAVLALSFIAYLPYSKAIHMILGFAGLFMRDPLAGKRLPKVAEDAERMGYAGLPDLSRKELLNLDSCTKCGRCHDACPAWASGRPLSPRDVVLGLREDAERALGGRSWLRESINYNVSGPFDGIGIRAETLWSCTTCLACVDICPVGVEHVPLMVQLRRHLVEQGIMETPLQEVLEDMMRYGNSFAAPESDRGEWARELSFEIKDARTSAVDFLWFVGDYASYDPEAQRSTRIAARLFHAANLDFGILYDGERNAGNDIRRVGEEGLFEYLVEHNQTSFDAANFKRIITTDPHSYNTLKNEYADLKVPIYHATEVISELIDDGRLIINKKLSGRVTYHDPCHLSRYAGIIEPPRKILTALGLTLIEMERSRENSFCCGGGGGRIWMSEAAAGQRPCDQRLAEAELIDELDQFVVACPKCFSLFNAALGTQEKSSFELNDVIELTGQAVLVTQDKLTEVGSAL